MKETRRDFLKLGPARAVVVSAGLGSIVNGCTETKRWTDYNLGVGEEVSIKSAGFHYDIRLEGVYQIDGVKSADLTVNGETHTLRHAPGEFRRSLRNGELVRYRQDLDTDHIDVLKINGTDTETLEDDSVKFSHVYGR